MKKYLKILASLAIAMLALASTAARADTWNWWYAGSGVSASGTLTTFGNASSPEAVTSFMGLRNGDTILGLVPLATDGGFNYDNMFQSMFPVVNLAGILFDAGPGAAPSGHYNLFYDADLGTYLDGYYGVNGWVQTAVEVRVEHQTAPVPEPETYALMLAGLGVVGFISRRRKHASRGEQKFVAIR